LGKPVTLFAEDNGFRRERLKVEISNYFTEVKEAPEFEKDFLSDGGSEGGEQTTVFYTEGNSHLRDARLKIAKFSVPRGQKRVNDIRAHPVDYVKSVRDYEDYANTIGPYVVKES